MANINNRLFEWVDDIVEVRTNYSKRDCYNILMNKLKALQGIDRSFLSEITSRAENSFVYDIRYVPVYEMTVNVLYTRDYTETDKYTSGDVSVTIKTEKTAYDESTKTKYFYYGINESCRLDLFVGGKNERFYSLNLPSDLPYNLYNETNNCKYSSYDIQKMEDATAPTITGYRRDILGSFCRVYFVPVIYIGYQYAGSEYYAIINMHNGYSYYQYKISNASANKATEAYQKSKKAYIIRVILSVIAIACSIAAIFISSRKFLAIAFAFLGICTQFGCWTRLKTTGLNMRDYKNAYAVSDENGENLRSSIGTSITVHNVFSIILLVISIISFFD